MLTLLYSTYNHLLISSSLGGTSVCLCPLLRFCILLPTLFWIFLSSLLFLTLIITHYFFLIVLSSVSLMFSPTAFCFVCLGVPLTLQVFVQILMVLCCTLVFYRTLESVWVGWAFNGWSSLSAVLPACLPIKPLSCQHWQAFSLASRILPSSSKLHFCFAQRQIQKGLESPFLSLSSSICA